MDPAVALVQCYLRVNGYFTVAEFPVVQRTPGGALQTATDLDLLAFRFPHAGHLVPGIGAGDARDRTLHVLDPALGVPLDEADMLVAEVKEGEATLNAAADDPAVLRAMLTRFGCCSPDEAARLTERLRQKGHLVLANGHHLRRLAFGSRVSPGAERLETPYRALPLGHVTAFLLRYVREHWGVLRTSGTKDETLATLLLWEKARRGSQADDDRARATPDASGPPARAARAPSGGSVAPPRALADGRSGGPRGPAPA